MLKSCSWHAALQPSWLVTIFFLATCLLLKSPLSSFEQSPFHIQ